MPKINIDINAFVDARMPTRNVVYRFIQCEELIEKLVINWRRIGLFPIDSTTIGWHVGNHFIVQKPEMQKSMYQYSGSGEKNSTQKARLRFVR